MKKPKIKNCKRNGWMLFMLVKFPTFILTVGKMLPSVCSLSWLFDWSMLRIFTFQPLQGIPYHWLKFLLSNIIVQHSFHKSWQSLIISHFFCHYKFVGKTKIITCKSWNFFSKLTLAARAYCVCIGRPIRPSKRLWERCWHLVEHSKAWSEWGLLI